MTMLKLAAVLDRVYSGETADTRPMLRDLAIRDNVCTFTVDELIATFSLTVTLNPNGSLVEDCDGDCRTFDSLTEYETYLKGLFVA